MGAPEKTQVPLTQRTAFLANKMGQLLLEQAERGFGELGLNARTFFVLASVDPDVPRSQQEIAQIVAVDPTTLGVLVDDLEARGLVDRSRNKRDKRRYDLTLSASGVSTLTAAHAALDAVEREFFAPLSARQRSDLGALLRKLIAGRWPPPSD